MQATDIKEVNFYELSEYIFSQEPPGPGSLPQSSETNLAGFQSGQDWLILVVDDDAAIRDMLETLLEEEGYAVVLARHGQDALELLKTVKPALILLDLMMPVMDGWQFLDNLSRNPALQGLPVVLLSASRSVGEATKQAQVKAYLPKPFELEKLLLNIEQNLRKD